MSPVICIGTRMQDGATWHAVGLKKNVKYPRLFQHPVSTAIHHEIGSGFTDPCKAVVVILFARWLSIYLGIS